MTTHDFKRSNYDSCVYFKKNHDGSFVYLLLYVGDMLIATKDIRETLLEPKGIYWESTKYEDYGDYER